MVPECLCEGDWGEVRMVVLFTFGVRVEVQQLDESANNYSILSQTAAAFGAFIIMGLMGSA